VLRPTNAYRGGVEFGRYAFGEIEIDGVTYEHDVVIDGGHLRKRKKGPSKTLRAGYGHTPLSAAEDLPWACDRLVIGSGADGALPVLPEVTEEAARRGVELVIVPTVDAIELLREAGPGTNAVLHVTC
jgi:hypothetical protein